MSATMSCASSAADLSHMSLDAYLAEDGKDDNTEEALVFNQDVLDYLSEKSDPLHPLISSLFVADELISSELISKIAAKAKKFLNQSSKKQKKNKCVRICEGVLVIPARNVVDEETHQESHNDNIVEDEEHTNDVEEPNDDNDIQLDRSSLNADFCKTWAELIQEPPKQAEPVKEQKLKKRKLKDLGPEKVAKKLKGGTNMISKAQSTSSSQHSKKQGNIPVKSLCNPENKSLQSKPNLPTQHKSTLPKCYSRAKEEGRKALKVNPIVIKKCNNQLIVDKNKRRAVGFPSENLLKNNMMRIPKRAQNLSQSDKERLREKARVIAQSNIFKSNRSTNKVPLLSGANMKTNSSDSVDLFGDFNSPCPAKLPTYKPLPEGRKSSFELIWARQKKGAKERNYNPRFARLIKPAIDEGKFSDLFALQSVKCNKVLLQNRVKDSKGNMIGQTIARDRETPRFSNRQPLAQFVPPPNYRPAPIARGKAPNNRAYRKIRNMCSKYDMESNEIQLNNDISACLNNVLDMFTSQALSEWGDSCTPLQHALKKLKWVVDPCPSSRPYLFVDYLQMCLRVKEKGYPMHRVVKYIHGFRNMRTPVYFPLPTKPNLDEYGWPLPIKNIYTPKMIDFNEQHDADRTTAEAEAHFGQRFCLAKGKKRRRC